MQNPTIQQVVEALRSANNVLITVKNSPSVDELTASIALTLIMNHMNKHATTVFSGKVPSTIEFLQPEMAIESNTDSLRDFIIALDKSKADKLRYKVEDNVVRIFITPYKSSISEADLEFSQGDFNVDVVVALGVLSRDDFDQAVMAHGRILHDATVIAITNQQLQQEVGVVNWQDPQASSVSEMIASITDLFGTKVVDSQIATALLTGIVAETDRFKNEKTTPQVLSVSSMLMTEGANQMLIAEELEHPEQQEEITESAFQPLDPVSQDGAGNADGSQDGILSVSHDDTASVGNINIDEQGNINSFGAVGDAPLEHNDSQPFLPPISGASAENAMLPSVQETTELLPPIEGMPAADDATSLPPSDIVPERPYLDPLDPAHHSEDENLSEPSGLFGDSMHATSHGQGTDGSASMLGHGPKVIQPLGQDAASDQNAPLDSLQNVAELPAEPAADSLFAGSGHTTDMPGDYQTVASDPVAPYSPPPSMHNDYHDDVSQQPEEHHDLPAAPAPSDSDVELPKGPETLADIERIVGSDHVKQSEALSQLPPANNDEHNVDDFIGSTRAPEVSAELPAPPLEGVAHDDVAQATSPPISAPELEVPPQVEATHTPEPIVVEPYQPPVPLHDAAARDLSLPPLGPPPLTMPQATNQMEFYEPDGTKKNPFTNPS